MSWQAEPSDSHNDSEFRSEGALTLKALAANATTMTVTVDWMISKFVQMCSHR